MPLARTSTSALFLAVALYGCSESTAVVDAAACPDGSIEVNGICRKRCTAVTECLITEACLNRVCVPAPAGPPRILRFSVTPQTLEPNEIAEVVYSVANADVVQAEFDTGFGTPNRFFLSDQLFGVLDTPPLNVDGTLTLFAISSASGDTDTRMITIDIETPELSIEQFEASPTTVTPGGPTTLDWRVSGSASVSILTEAGAVVLSPAPPVGSVTLPVDTTTVFVLRATDEAGATDEESVQVDVVNDINPEVTALTVDPDVGSTGDGALLTWQTRGAQGIRVRSGGRFGEVLYESVELSFVNRGQFVVLPQTDESQFTVEAFSGNRSGIETVQTVVFEKPAVQIVDFDATPELFEAPTQEVLVSWEVEPADGAVVALSVRGEAPSSVGTDDAVSFVLTSPRTVIFDLFASGEGGGARGVTRVWRLLAETEPNDDRGSADQPDGFAITGALSTNMPNDEDDIDWFAFTVPAGGSASAAFYGETECTDSFVLRLRSVNRVLDQARPTSAGCPTVAAAGLAAGQYFVAMEADQGAPPLSYVLGVSVEPPRCGDGFRAPSEACDDGNLRVGDGCNVDCQIEPEYVYQAMAEPSPPWKAPPPASTELQWLTYSTGQPELASDAGFAVVALPFQFPFYGRQYSGVVVHTDGYLSFHPDVAGAGVDPANAWGAIRPHALVAVLNTDLAFPDSASVRTWQENDMRFGQVVWFDFSEARVNGEMTDVGQTRIGLTKLGEIILRYGTRKSDIAFNAGIEDHTGTRQVSVCDDATCPADVPVENTDIVFGNTIR